MKKQPQKPNKDGRANKLQLKRERIRVLTDKQLDGVAGGAGCTSTVISDGCHTGECTIVQ
jgi:hypothetical protein